MQTKGVGGAEHRPDIVERPYVVEHRAYTYLGLCTEGVYIVAVQVGDGLLAVTVRGHGLCGVGVPARAQHPHGTGDKAARRGTGMRQRKAFGFHRHAVDMYDVDFDAAVAVAAVGIAVRRIGRQVALDGLHGVEHVQGCRHLIIILKIQGHAQIEKGIVGFVSPRLGDDKVGLSHECLRKSRGKPADGRLNQRAPLSAVTAYIKINTAHYIVVLQVMERRFFNRLLLNTRMVAGC